MSLGHYHLAYHKHERRRLYIIMIGQITGTPDDGFWPFTAKGWDIHDSILPIHPA